MVGGFLNGWIEDSYGVKASFYANIIQLVIAYGLIIYYSTFSGFNFAFAFAMNTAWGFMDAGLNVFAECVCGFQFASVSIPFSIFFFAQSFFCFAGTFTAAGLKTKNSYLYFYIGSAVFAFFSWMLFWFTFDLIEENDPDGQKRAQIEKHRKGSLESKLSASERQSY